ncbi:MAG: hypothetical protein NWE99_02905 [Candidatus Bathyarchaeota archaeon]|nr:hypothetical protein [Candidatus Bathyarchaeota archaeon]
MIVKNVLKQGYPFVEAIASALPICDEFLIAEGYSTDGTFEVVQRLSKSNRKIKIFRQHWPAVRRMKVLGELTNAVRKKCRFNYIFSVQANEVVHEGSVDFIRALPEMLPNVHSFSFPYLHLMWSYRFSQEYRLRFAKNLPGIVAIGDAWALGPSRAFIVSEAFKSLRNPRRFLRLIGRGVEWTYADSANNNFSKAIYLPRPIFRYWSLFPRDCLEKCARHAEMFNLPRFNETINVLKDYIEDAPAFWERASAIARAGVLGINYPEAFRFVRKEEHPKMIQGFLSDTQSKSYYVREEILEAIKGL